MTMAAFSGPTRPDDAPTLFPLPVIRRPSPFGGLERYAADLIMADPPWRFELYSERGEEKSAQAHYDTMSLDDIAALPVRDLGRPDSVLWLWGTWPLLPAQIEIVAAWGYRFVTGGVWHKRTVNGKSAFGTGYRLRSACEPFLIGVSGEPETAKSVRNVVEGVVREHSRKPPEAYRAAERLVMGEQTFETFRAERGRDCRLVELFSRESRAGWACWGNESGKFDGETA